MNEKIADWIAVGVIIGIAGYVHTNSSISAEVRRGLIVGVLIASVGWGIIAKRAARITVLKRRRLYKDIWRRRGPIETLLSKSEEDLVKLLGRIKGVTPSNLIFIAGCLAAIEFKSELLGLILALGLGFIAFRLHRTARTLDRITPSDADRSEPTVRLPESPTGRYVVELNLDAVHDFIAPPAALPFWTHIGAANWLRRCGFDRIAVNKWTASKSAFVYLEPDEVLSIAALQ